MRRLVDADVLYEQIAKKEELARQRVLDTPSMMPNGNLNPSAIRYTAQLDERTQMKFMIADAPIIDAIPVSFIQELIKQDNQFIEAYGGIQECEVIVDGLIERVTNYEVLIEKWREKNGTETD